MLEYALGRSFYNLLQIVVSRSASTKDRLYIHHAMISGSAIWVLLELLCGSGDILFSGVLWDMISLLSVSYQPVHTLDESAEALVQFGPLLSIQPQPRKCDYWSRSGHNPAKYYLAPSPGGHLSLQC